MIPLLAKLIQRKEADDASKRHALGTACGAMGIALNLLLFIGKLIVSLITGSISIRADAFNNLSDAGSSLVMLFGLLLARQRPDTEHPFGHGRMEYISGMVISMIVVLMGFSLMQTSVEKIIDPQPVAFSTVSALILACAVLVKLIMFSYNRKYGKLTDSTALRATAVDSLSDALATGAVLGATCAQHFFGWQIDGYVGCAVSLVVFISGVKTMRETIEPLLGQPPQQQLIEEIERIVLKHPGIIGMHDLVVHDYGPGRLMISLHAEVSAEGDLMLLHDTIDNAEHELREQLGCAAVIHMDPVVVADERTADMRMRVGELVKALDERATFHDFRMVEGPTHTNLIFDVAIPYGVSITDEQIRQRMTHMVRALEGNYFAVIEVDRH